MRPPSPWSAFSGMGGRGSCRRRSGAMSGRSSSKNPDVHEDGDMGTEDTGNNGGVQPQSSRGRERLAKILEAATELFLRDGYGATSIDAILEVSGGSKATLYSYFPTKDDLFRAVVEDVLASSSTHEPRLNTAADPRTCLIEFSVQRLEQL